MDELKHFGVPGMKWGVRRTKTPINKRYSDWRRQEDKKIIGALGVRSVNKRMNKGMSWQKAYNRTVGKQLVVGTLVAVGAYPLASYLATTKGQESLKKGAASAKDFLWKLGSSNLITSTGEIVLNPKNYSIIPSITDLAIRR